MSTGANIYYRYGKGSPKERVDLIYVNYPQFKSIIEGCRSKLIYEIEAEKEYSHRKDIGELGIRVQTTGHYSDRTSSQAILTTIKAKKHSSDQLAMLPPRNVQSTLLQSPLPEKICGIARLKGICSIMP